MVDQKKFVGTWIYLDSPEESSHFPNNKGKSSTPEFQAVYWRCVVVFFETSLRVHQNENYIQHILFTNTNHIPIVDGMDLKEYFEKNNIEVVILDNKYPLPNNYFSSFRNQFFEFSILDFMAEKMDGKDAFLLLDSDCVFSKSVVEHFEHLKQVSSITLDVGYNADAKIHGITRKEMRGIFNELDFKIEEDPMYSGGEFLLAQGDFIKEVANDFPKLYEWLLQRNLDKKPKFNEEAHVLSYYYYKHNAKLGVANAFVKRMWTNRNHYRNIKKGDENLSIWHMPNEKPMGFANTFKYINSKGTLKNLDNQGFHQLLVQNFLKASNHKLDLPRYIKAKIEHMFN